MLRYVSCYLNGSFLNMFLSAPVDGTCHSLTAGQGHVQVLLQKFCRGFLNICDLGRISIQSLKERVLQHRGQQETAMRRISGYTVGRKVTTSKLEKRSKHKWSCRAWEGEGIAWSKRQEVLTRLADVLPCYMKE